MIFATDLVPQLGTFSMAADTRGQFHEWSKEQYVVRNSRCPLKLLPNNAPTLTRELSALSTSQTSRNEKVPADLHAAAPPPGAEPRGDRRGGHASAAA